MLNEIYKESNPLAHAGAGNKFTLGWWPLHQTITSLISQSVVKYEEKYIKEKYDGKS